MNGVVLPDGFRFEPILRICPRCGLDLSNEVPESCGNEKEKTMKFEASKKEKLLIGLVVLFLALDFACYEMYGRGLIFGNLLTVHVNFNYSVTTPNTTSQPSSENQGRNLGQVNVYSDIHIDHSINVKSSPLNRCNELDINPFGCCSCQKGTHRGEIRVNGNVSEIIHAWKFITSFRGV